MASDLFLNQPPSKVIPQIQGQPSCAGFSDHYAALPDGGDKEELLLLDSEPRECSPDHQVTSCPLIGNKPSRYLDPIWHPTEMCVLRASAHHIFRSSNARIGTGSTENKSSGNSEIPFHCGVLMYRDLSSNKIPCQVQVELYILTNGCQGRNVGKILQGLSSRDQHCWFNCPCPSPLDQVVDIYSSFQFDFSLPALSLLSLVLTLCITGKERKLKWHKVLLMSV